MGTHCARAGNATRANQAQQNGVVAPQKHGKLKLRLIHDLKRSGVNAQVNP